jgi:hypothetical protein
MRLRPTDRLALRELFLRRRIEYTTHDAARLLRLNLGEVLAMIETGKIHAETRRKRRQLGGCREALILWPDLAAAALRQWTPVQVFDALGERAREILPDLFRPVALRNVRLPAYQVRFLEAIARDSRVTLEACIYAAIHATVASGDPKAIDRLVPGAWEAISFPKR